MISSTLLSMLPSYCTDLSLTTILIGMLVLGVASYFVYTRFFRKNIPTVVENYSSHVHESTQQSQDEHHQEAIHMINSQNPPESESESTPSIDTVDQSPHEMA